VKGASGLLVAILIVVCLLLAARACWGAPAKPAPGDAVPWQPIFKTVAGTRWIDRAAQVQAESRFNAQAKSPVGAVGPAQFMPDTWKLWGKGDPTDPAAAIPAQHHYMLWIEARVGGHLDPALAGYNWGLGRVLRVQRRVAALGEPGDAAWVRLCPAETQGYLIHNLQNRTTIQRKVGTP
jgi:hypothetical protein